MALIAAALACGQGAPCGPMLSVGASEADNLALRSVGIPGARFSPPVTQGQFRVMGLVSLVAKWPGWAQIMPVGIAEDGVCVPDSIGVPVVVQVVAGITPVCLVGGSPRAGQNRPCG